MSPDSAPVALHRDSADPVRLKWHRARRRAADRPFTRDRILEGMRLGASIEIDLRVRDDLRYAVIHDVDDPPRLYLDDLAALLADAEIHPDALLQLDFKDTHAQLDQAAVDRFAESVAPFAGHAIVSCGDPVAVAMLTGPVPDIRIGYDPCHRWAVHRVLATRRFTRFVGRAIQASPDAEMVYLERRLILGAARSGFDIVDAFHRRGRTVDAYTIQTIDEPSMLDVRRLVRLDVDQITTDDPEGLLAYPAS